MLEELSIFHDDWVHFVSGHISEYVYREDIVQEMYLKAHRTKNQKALLDKDGKANKKYIFQMLKSLCVDYNRAKSRVVKENVDVLSNLEETHSNGLELCDIQDINRKHHEVRAKLRKADPYYESLYLVKTCAEKPTFRELSKQTGIATSTLCKNVKQIKIILSAS